MQFISMTAHLLGIIRYCMINESSVSLHYYGLDDKTIKTFFVPQNKIASSAEVIFHINYIASHVVPQPCTNQPHSFSGFWLFCCTWRCVLKCNVQYYSCSVYLLLQQCHLCLLASGASQTKKSARRNNATKAGTRQSIIKSSGYYMHSLKQTITK